MSPRKTDERLIFLYHVHKNINEYIKFSDGKAGILLASSGVLLTLLLRWASEEQFQFGGVQFILFMLCLVSLSLSFILSFYSVYPRTKPQRSDGLIFWENILKKQPDEYVKAISGLDTNKILSEISLDVYNISKVAHKKYRIVKCSMVALGIALIFAMMLWLLTIEFPVPDPL